MKKLILTTTLSIATLFGSSLLDGKKAFEKKDYKSAYKLFVKTAQDGMVAKYNLAVMYQNGFGVKKDLTKAIAFYKLSALDGYAPAKKALSIIEKAINKNRSKKEKASVGYLTIRSNLFKDSVYVDGKYMGSTKLTLPLSANTIHKVEVRKKGYITYRFNDIVLKPKEKRTIKAILKQK